MIKRINILPFSVLRLVAGNTLMLMLLVVSLVSCANDDYTGVEGGNEGMPISFNMGTIATTRANTPLETYVNDIRLYGTKYDGTNENRVFDNYVLWYDYANTGKTTTNTNDWEYVGSTSDASKSDLSSEATTIAAQRTKYWDYNCPHYYFWAVAKAGQGKFTSATTGAVSSFTVTNEIKIADLDNDNKVLYYTDPILVARDGTTTGDNAGSYGKPVNLVFKRVTSKVRVGFYEQIKGWAVKDMYFYSADETKSSTADDVTLYSASEVFPTSAKATINYTYDNTPAANLAVTSTAAEKTLSMGALQYTSRTEDNKLTGNYISADKSVPTYAKGNMANNYRSIIPNASTGEITLQCDFTLYSTDTDETINVTGAKVTIPADDTQWLANTAYTYIFKITNSLKPITLDAVYKVDETQETTEDLVDPS